MPIEQPAGSHDVGQWQTLHNRHTGETLRMRRVVRDGVLCLELKGTLPARCDGPPLHIHTVEDERGIVASGTLSAEVDGRVLRVAHGDSVVFPKGSAHRWWNGSDEPLAFDGWAVPAVDLDVYLGAVFEVLNSGPVNRPPVFYMAHLAWRHRKTQVALFAPRWVQAVLVPLLVLTGTLLGKYRGTEWPGCPARFAPAPTVHGAAPGLMSA